MAAKTVLVPTTPGSLYGGSRNILKNFACPVPLEKYFFNGGAVNGGSINNCYNKDYLASGGNTAFFGANSNKLDLSRGAEPLSNKNGGMGGGAELRYEEAKMDSIFQKE